MFCFIIWWILVYILMFICVDDVSGFICFRMFVWIDWCLIGNVIGGIIILLLLFLNGDGLFGLIL